MTPLGAVGAVTPTAPAAGDTDAAKKAAGVADAAKQLEVTFLTQLLQAMRKTVPESDFLPKSPERDVYNGEFDRSVAEALAARDPLGLVQALGPGQAASSSEPKMSITAVGHQQVDKPEGGRRSNP